MGENPYCPSAITVVINFLQLCKDHFTLHYSSVNSAKSALQNVVTVQGHNIADFKLMQDFMKGVLRDSPTMPKYHNIWDPQVVLNQIEQWGPPHQLPLKLLAQKLLMLLLLCSGQRLQTIFSFTLDNLDFTPDGFVFTVMKSLKRRMVGTAVQYKAFPQNSNLCPKQLLIQYLHVTAGHRQSQQLFLSYQQPYRPVKQCTLSRWVTQVLEASGVNTGIFKPHSTRAASSSGAARGGAQIDTILAAGGWASANTFTTWYQRPVRSNNFQQAMYQAANVM